MYDILSLKGGVEQKMKILITGIGITGKSTFRKSLRDVFSDIGLDVKDFDADYEKIPSEFSKNTIYLIEDVHGTLPKEAVLPLNSYDLILYVRPSVISHILFWLKRMIDWFKTGKYSWDKNIGWYGTGKSYDIQNIFPIFRAFLRDFRNRKKWISNDLRELSSSRYVTVRSRWTYKGIKFSVKKTFAT